MKGVNAQDACVSTQVTVVSECAALPLCWQNTLCVKWLHPLVCASSESDIRAQIRKSPCGRNECLLAQHT